MSPIALLGLAWMVSVALGIWVIAALLFLAELRERKSDKTHVHSPADSHQLHLSRSV